MTISHCTCNATVHLGSTKQLSTSLTLSTCLIPMALKPVGVKCLFLNSCRKNMLVKTCKKRLCLLNLLYTSYTGLKTFIVFNLHLCYIKNQSRDKCVMAFRPYLQMMHQIFGGHKSLFRVCNHTYLLKCPDSTKGGKKWNLGRNGIVIFLIKLLLLGDRP